MSKRSQKNKDADVAAKLVAGTAKHFANVPLITVGSVTTTPADFAKRMQEIVDLRASANATKATAKASLVAEQAKLPALTGAMAVYRAYVKASFSNSPDVLADFGLAPRKATTPLTVEQKAASAAKRAATRAARHTMGKVQKLSVTGDVVGVVVTPVTAPKPDRPAPGASGASTGPTSQEASQ